MSTGLECEFLWLQASGKPDGEWFYILQSWDCPVGAWDWHEYATAYGPFNSEDSAHEHLRANHANPGGYSTCENPLDPASLSSATQDKIQNARADRFAASGGTNRR
jgi:hypothetical protein